MTAMEVPRVGDMWVYFGTLMGVMALLQTFLHTLVPSEVRAFGGRLCKRAWNWMSSYTVIDFPEYDGSTCNELYGAIKLHLSNSSGSGSSGRCSPPPLWQVAQRVSLCRSANSSSLSCSPADSERLPDSFDGASLAWEHQRTARHGHVPVPWSRQVSEENRKFVLRVHKGDKERVLVRYLEHIVENAKEIRRLAQDRLLYTNARTAGGGSSWEIRGSQPWDSFPFKHPSTFETLALDPARKSRIQSDLRAFVAGERFYQKIGRAWKRGYLLYGPPGTGKSSLIAAIANFLNYDVFDLELTHVHSNAELRKLLVRTTRKSIIVIEDIDCSLNLTNRTKKPATTSNEETEQGQSLITLSGLLNFTDGLWSCCGNERFFVFTTNHIERLDPALLRSGRMDMHICMSYCTFPAFRILASNYLTLLDHSLFSTIESIINDAHITPAEVSEILLRNRDQPDIAMEELLTELERCKAKPLPQAPHLMPYNYDKEEEKHTLEEEKPNQEEGLIIDGSKGSDYDDSVKDDDSINVACKCFRRRGLSKEHKPHQDNTNTGISKDGVGFVKGI